jgi:hypothetical protein
MFTCKIFDVKVFFNSDEEEELLKFGYPELSVHPFKWPWLRPLLPRVQHLGFVAPLLIQ